MKYHIKKRIKKYLVIKNILMWNKSYKKQEQIFCSDNKRMAINFKSQEKN